MSTLATGHNNSVAALSVVLCGPWAKALAGGATWALVALLRRLHLVQRRQNTFEHNLFGDDDLADVLTTRALLPGGSERVAVSWDVPEAARDVEITERVTVDEGPTGGISNECLEDNNASERALTCAGLR